MGVCTLCHGGGACGVWVDGRDSIMCMVYTFIGLCVHGGMLVRERVGKAWWQCVWCMTGWLQLPGVHGRDLSGIYSPMCAGWYAGTCKSGWGLDGMYGVHVAVQGACVLAYLQGP